MFWPPLCNHTDNPSRKPPPSNQRVNIPRLGGTLTISIVKSETSSSPVSKAHPPHRSAKAQVLAELQERSKLGERKRPSDTVEHLRFEVKWEPQRVALGMSIPFEAVTLPEGELRVVSETFWYYLYELNLFSPQGSR